MHSSPPSRVTSAGVTLIELAITIALVGILGALIVNFVQPVRSYIDSSRRAALADAADIALRRMGRDLRLALPNSVRVTNSGTVYYIELLLVRTGGRYRLESDPADTTATCPDGSSSSAASNVLTIGSADTCFKTLGDIPRIGEVVTGSDYVVVFNLQPGTDKADAYQTACGAVCNKSLISTAANGAGSERIEFASNTFTYESPGNRFFIIEGAVSYICDPSAKTLTRRSGYTIVATQPTTTFTGGTSALLANGVSGCTFTYDANISAGAGLATLALTLAMQDSLGSTESVNLYNAVHVSNVP
jgi:MSHA biogenesis protein MshO